MFLDNENTTHNTQEVQQARKRTTYKTKPSKQNIMGVFKSIRRRNHGRGMLGGKKHLNYSAISEGSGNTHNDSKEDSHDDDMFAATAPLISTSAPLSEVAESTSPVAVSPMASPEKMTKKTSFKKNNKDTKPKMTMEPKRVSLEPVAPLGVVVNEDEWEEISHISGISNRSEEKKPDLSSVEIREDLDALAAAFEGTTNPVTPTKVKTVAVAPVTPTKKMGSTVRTMAAAFEASTTPPAKTSSAPAVVSPAVESPGKAIVHILTGVDGENAISGDRESSENGSKLSHVFEDDQSSNVPETSVEDFSAYNAANATKVIPFSMRENSGPKFEAVFDDTFQKEMKTAPTNAPSFDGSASTAFTDNKSDSIKNIRTVNNKDADAANETASVVSFKSVQKKLHEIDATMRSSVQKLADDAAAMSPEFTRTSPACAFPSTTDLKKDFEDSIQHIKKELSSFYETSGMAAARQKAEEQVNKIPQTFFQRKTMPDDDAASHYSKDMFEDKPELRRGSF